MYRIKYSGPLRPIFLEPPNEGERVSRSRHRPVRTWQPKLSNNDTHKYRRINRSQSIRRMLQSNARDVIPDTRIGRMDSWPLYNEIWQLGEVHKIETYLQSIPEGPALLNMGTNIRPLSVNRFVKLCNLILKHIDPQLYVLTEDNYVDLLRGYLIKLRFPGTVTDLILLTVNTWNSWPFVIAILSWLFKCLDLEDVPEHKTDFHLPKIDLEENTVSKIDLEENTVPKIDLEENTVSKIDLEENTVSKIDLEQNTVSKIEFEEETMSKVAKIDIVSSDIDIPKSNIIYPPQVISNDPDDDPEDYKQKIDEFNVNFANFYNSQDQESKEIINLAMAEFEQRDTIPSMKDKPEVVLPHEMCEYQQKFDEKNDAHKIKPLWPLNTSCSGLRELLEKKKQKSKENNLKAIEELSTKLSRMKRTLDNLQKEYTTVKRRRNMFIKENKYLRYKFLKLNHSLVTEACSPLPEFDPLRKGLPDNLTVQPDCSDAVDPPRIVENESVCTVPKASNLPGEMNSVRDDVEQNPTIADWIRRRRRVCLIRDTLKQFVSVQRSQNQTKIDQSDDSVFKKPEVPKKYQ